jgi:hypothetical protein
MAQIWFLGGGGSISSVGGGGSVFPVSCVSLPVCPRRRRCGEVAAASFSLVLPATFLSPLCSCWVLCSARFGARFWRRRSAASVVVAVSLW